MKTRLLTLLNVGYFLLLTACCHEVELEDFFFNIESVSPLNFDHTTIEFINEDNCGISATSYAMVFKTEAPSIKNARPRKKGGIFRSPDCRGIVYPPFLLEDQVASIKIMATEDFSQTYPAGADLGGLFNPIWITKDNPFSTPPSLIEEISGGLKSEYLNSELVRYHDAVDYRNQKLVNFLGLKLIERPTRPVLLQFKLEFVFQSGKAMSGLTNPVLLK